MISYFLRAIHIGPACALLATPLLRAADFYVAPTGSNASPGSENQPFATITYALTQASAGDTIYVQPGEYPETVTANSRNGTSTQPIRIVGTQRINGHPAATITAFDTITPGSDNFGNWQVHSGSIYRIDVPASWVQTVGYNLVEVDGQLLAPARWPDVDAVLDFDRNNMSEAEDGALNGPTSTPAIYTGRTGFYSGSYTDNALASFATDSWVGAHIDLTAGQGWWPKTGVVTASTSDSVTFAWRINDPNTWPEWRETPSAGDRYFLFGHLQALSRPGEFFLDTNGINGPANRLYVWLPDSRSPVGRTVKLRKRTITLNLLDSNYLEFENLALMAGSIEMDADCQNLTFRTLRQQYGSMRQNTITFSNVAAVRVRGGGHRFSDCDISDVIGVGIRIRGDDCVFENNAIYRVRDNIFDFANEDPDNASVNHIVRGNSLFDTGSVTINMGLESSLLTFNHCYRAGLRVIDVAVINTWNGGDLGGTEVSYNWVHDGLAPLDKGRNPNWNGAAGIRLDGGHASLGTSNVLVHHNVVWNNNQETSIAMWALKPGQERYDEDNPANTDALVRVYHNTVDAEIDAVGGADGSTEMGFEYRRNIATDFDGPIDEAEITDNNFSNPSRTYAGNTSLEPGFINPLKRNYTLRTDSALRDLGTPVSGITESGQEAYIGAYNPNALPWRPGARIRDVDLTGLQAQVTNEGGTRYVLVHGAPPGRKFPDTFQVRVAGRMATAVTTRYNVDRHVEEARATIDLSGLAGEQTVEVSLDGSTFFQTEKPLDVTTPQPAPEIAIHGVIPATAVAQGSIPLSLDSDNIFDVPAPLYAVELSNLDETDLNEQPVALVLNTSSWNSLGMTSNGDNLRFYDEDGRTELRFFIESGLGSTHTLIWLARGEAAASASADYISVHESHNTSQFCYFGFPADASTSASDPAVLNDHYAFFDDDRRTLHFQANTLADSLTNGATVAQWPDASPSDYPGLQSLPGEQPTYREGRVNGLGVVEFDGLDWLSVNGTAGVGTTAYTSYAVYRNPDPQPGEDPWQRILSGRMDNNETDWESGVWHMINVETLSGISIPNTTAVLSVHSNDQPRNGQNLVIGKQTMGADDSEGERDRYVGEIAEIIFFDEDVTTSVNEEMAADIEHYLNHKWGLQSGPTAMLRPAANLNPLQVLLDGQAVTNLEVLPDGDIHFTAPAFASGAPLPRTIELEVILPDGARINLPGALAVVANAHQSNVYEGFDYPAAGILGNGNGGYGWNGGWGQNGSLSGNGVSGSSPIGITSGSMSLPMDYAAQISGNRLGDHDEYGIYAMRALADPIDFGTDGVVYFSFTASTTGGGGTAYIFLGLVEQGTFASRFIDIGPWQSGIYLRQDGSNVSAGSYIPGTDAFILGKLITAASGNDILQLKTYTAANSVDGEPAIWDVTHTFNTSVVIDRISVETSGIQTGYLDEIRIGRRANEVVEHAFQHWLSEKGYTGSDATPDADPDGNSLSNLTEYALGFSGSGTIVAVLPSSVITQVSNEPYLALTFQGLNRSSDVQYLVLRSDDLVNWEAEPVWQSGGNDDTHLVQSIDNGDGTRRLTVRFPSSLRESRQFLRLIVEEAP